MQKMGIAMNKTGDPSLETGRVEVAGGDGVRPLRPRGSVARFFSPLPTGSPMNVRLGVGLMMLAPLPIEWLL